jgi:uncharacterized surface protein with fasciclin (FAS1) repeats
MIDLATHFRRGLALGAGLLALALVAAGCDAFTDKDLGDSNPQTPTIAQYIQEVRVLSSLEAAVDEAGLAETLENDGPFTVFAPVDDAFSPALDPSLNQQVIQKVVQDHAVSGAVLSSELSDGQTVPTLSGDSLTIGTAGGVTVNRATVTNADAEASNGVVHVVDNLLIDAVDRATLTPRFTIFARLVKEAGLADTLKTGGRTIFAPTNEALLDALDQDGNGSIESSEIGPRSALEDILKHHVLDRVFLAADVPTSETSVQTLAGTDLMVVRDESTGTVTITSGNEIATVGAADIVVDNGVIHGIDLMLTPYV